MFINFPIFYFNEVRMRIFTRGDYEIKFEESEKKIRKGKYLGSR